MFNESEGKSSLLWEVPDNKRDDYKKLIFGIPILILAVVASLATILNLGMSNAQIEQISSSTQAGVVSTTIVIIRNGMRYTILRWQSGWEVMLVDNFGVFYGSDGNSSSWDNVAHDFGYCYGWNNITGIKMKYKYQVNTIDDTPGSFLINESPYTLSLNGTMFLIKEIDQTIFVNQVEKDFSFVTDLVSQNVQTYGETDADITSFFQGEAFVNNSLKL